MTWELQSPVKRWRADGALGISKATKLADPEIKPPHPQNQALPQGFDPVATPILAGHWPDLPTPSQELWLARLADRLHELGPRATFELLREVVGAHAIADDVLERLKRYAQLNALTVALVGARDIPPAPIHEVRQ